MGDTEGRGAGLPLVAAALAATAVAVAVVLWTPLRLGVDDWAWPRVWERSWGGAGYSLGVYALVVAVVVVAWGRWPRARRAEEAALVGLLAGLGLVAQAVVGQQSPAGYQESVIAIALPGPNRYHGAARGVERLGPLLRRYPAWMREESHALVVTHPAGPVSLFWVLNHVFAGDEAGAARLVRWCEDHVGMGLRLRASAWGRRLFATTSEAELAGAWLATFVLRLLASAVVVPVYGLGRALYGRQGALAAAAFAVAIPSMLLFSPGLDQCYPVIAATACWLGYTAGRHRSGWRAALAGLAVSVGLFFTLAFAVVALWSGLLAVAGLRSGEGPVAGRGAGRLAAWGAAGLLVPVAALYLATGYNSLAAWWTSWEHNARFNEGQQRTYWKWVLVNPLDFVGFLGLPVACLLVRRAGREAWAVVRRRGGGRDWAMLVAVGVLAVLNVGGVNRGEVARLWMFAMPMCVVCAAAEMERLAPYRRAVLGVVLAAQCVQVVVFKGALDVLLGPYRHLGG